MKTFTFISTRELPEENLAVLGDAVTLILNECIGLSSENETASILVGANPYFDRFVSDKLQLLNSTIQTESKSNTFLEIFHPYPYWDWANEPLKGIEYQGFSCDVRKAEFKDSRRYIKKRIKKSDFLIIFSFLQEENVENELSQFIEACALQGKPHTIVYCNNNEFSYNPNFFEQHDYTQKACRLNTFC